MCVTCFVINLYRETTSAAAITAVRRILYAYIFGNTTCPLKVLGPRSQVKRGREKSPALIYRKSKAPPGSYAGSDRIHDMT